MLIITVTVLALLLVGAILFTRKLDEIIDSDFSGAEECLGHPDVKALSKVERDRQIAHGQGA